MLAARIKLPLLACFALMQCLVPLLHAHAHETNSVPQHVHIHALNLDTVRHAPQGESDCKVAASLPSSVETAAKQEPQNLPLFFISALPDLSATATPQGCRHAFFPLQASAVSNSPHARPPATAPPRQFAQPI